MNMKIKIPSQSDLSSLEEDLLMLNEDDMIDGLVTPVTENLCLDLIRSIPTCDLRTTPIFPNTALIKECASLLQTTPKVNEKNPFMSEFSSSLNRINDTNMLDEVLCEERFDLSENSLVPKDASVTESVTLDHDYSSSFRKRKLSSITDENTNDSLGSSFTDSFQSSSKSKKHRKRGIYRAEDVTNDDELKNYLERRKKNNLSSKASRANKKRLYGEMDSKCDILEKDNSRLKKKIVQLEELNKLIKETLFKQLKNK